MDKLGNSKVNHLDTSPLGDQNIFGLKVTVNHPMGVEVEKGIRKFSEKFERNTTARQRGIEELKSKIAQKNKIREERQFIAQNKDNIIPDSEYKQFVPKKIVEQLIPPVLTPKAAVPRGQ